MNRQKRKFLFIYHGSILETTEARGRIHERLLSKQISISQMSERLVQPKLNPRSLFVVVFFFLKKRMSDTIELLNWQESLLKINSFHYFLR